MAQVVTHWLLTTEAWGFTHVSPCGMCGVQSRTGTSFSKFFGFPLNIIPQWLSMLTYHLQDEQ
jgi:hypothetical protein